MLSADEGSAAVRLAREAAVAAAAGREPPAPPGSPPFRKPGGAFVTLRLDGHLRGCMGRADPAEPLGRTIIDAAVMAATRDPRFEPVSKSEMDRVAVEVTVLSPPGPLAGPARELPKRVKVGVHGLIVRRGVRAGLLLPQVPSEHGWGPEEFLCQTCAKAGLPMDAWLVDGTEVLAFSGQIFAERRPGGPIEEVRPGGGRAK